MSAKHGNSGQLCEFTFKHNLKNWSKTPQWHLYIKHRDNDAIAAERAARVDKVNNVRTRYPNHLLTVYPLTISASNSYPQSKSAKDPQTKRFVYDLRPQAVFFNLVLKIRVLKNRPHIPRFSRNPCDCLTSQRNFLGTNLPDGVLFRRNRWKSNWLNPAAYHLCVFISIANIDLCAQWHFGLVESFKDDVHSRTRTYLFT